MLLNDVDGDGVTSVEEIVRVIGMLMLLLSTSLACSCGQCCCSCRRCSLLVMSMPTAAAAVLLLVFPIFFFAPVTYACLPSAPLRALPFANVYEKAVFSRVDGSAGVAFGSIPRVLSYPGILSER